MAEMAIGHVSYYNGPLSVGVVDLVEPLKIGDVIHIKGFKEDFIQIIESLQIDYTPIQQAKSGEAVGIKVARPVRPNDRVFKLI